MEFELSEEQRMWQQAVHEFCAQEVKPLAAEMDERQEFNAEAVAKMEPLGLLGLNVPEQYGGAGIDAISAAIAIEELGWSDGGTGLSVSAHNGLACAPIALFGTEDQKQRWLPDLAKGAGGPRFPGPDRAWRRVGSDGRRQDACRAHERRMGVGWQQGLDYERQCGLTDCYFVPNRPKWRLESLEPYCRSHRCGRPPHPSRREEDGRSRFTYSCIDLRERACA